MPSHADEPIARRGKLAQGSTVLPCHGDPIGSFPPYGKASPRLPGFIDAIASLGRVINWHADPTLASPHASSDAEKRPRVQEPPRTVDDGDARTGTTDLKSCNEQSAWEGDFSRLDCCLGPPALWRAADHGAACLGDRTRCFGLAQNMPVNPRTGAGLKTALR